MGVKCEFFLLIEIVEKCWYVIVEGDMGIIVVVVVIVYFL